MATNKPTEEEQKMFDALLGLPEAILRHELKLDEEDEEADRPASTPKEEPPAGKFKTRLAAPDDPIFSEGWTVGPVRSAASLAREELPDEEEEEDYDDDEKQPTLEEVEREMIFRHVWRVRRRLPERYGQVCRVLARGGELGRGNIDVEFVSDGYRTVAPALSVCRAITWWRRKGPPPWFEDLEDPRGSP